MKALFNEPRQSLGSRQLIKPLRKEGFGIGRYRIRKLMEKLCLVVKRKKWFVLVTGSKHGLPVAGNVLDRDVTPTEESRVWATNITYIWSLQGWVHLAVVVGLYSRRVIGWHLDRRMETALASRALMIAINWRNPPTGLLHHPGRGSQYASHAYQALLRQHGMLCPMGRKGNCWDNAPAGGFFNSLKRGWLTGKMPTRQGKALWRM